MFYNRITDVLNSLKPDKKKIVFHHKRYTNDMNKYFQDTFTAFIKRDFWFIINTLVYLKQIVVT